MEKNRSPGPERSRARGRGRRAARARGWVAGVAAVLSLGLAPVGLECVVAPSEARAVVGRPLSPGSYAGVARRSSRRVSRRVSRRHAATYSLPAGCTLVGGYYQCGSTSYEQVVDGADVVYIEVEPD